MTINYKCLRKELSYKAEIFDYERVKTNYSLMTSNRYTQELMHAAFCFIHFVSFNLFHSEKKQERKKKLLHRH